MFLDILNWLYDCLDRIILALDNNTLFAVGTVSISFWEICLGFFTVSIIFGFFLRPRDGSVLGSFSNINKANNADIRRNQRTHRGRR